MTSRSQSDKNWGRSRCRREGSPTRREISPHSEPSAPSSSLPLTDKHHEELPAGQNDNVYSSYPSHTSYPVATGYTGDMGPGEDWPCARPSGDVNYQKGFSGYSAITTPCAPSYPGPNSYTSYNESSWNNGDNRHKGHNRVGQNDPLSGYGLYHPASSVSPAAPPTYSVPSMPSSGAASSSSPSNTASNPSLPTDGATSGTQSSYQCQIAIFELGTMTEVQERPRKKLDKEKSKAIWENRNMVCEKHKRSNKKCDPEKCRGNAQYKQRHPQPQQSRADEPPRTTLDHPTASLPLQMDNSQASVLPPSLHGESEIETRPWITTKSSSSYIPRGLSGVGPSDLNIHSSQSNSGAYIISDEPFGYQYAFEDGPGEALTSKDDSGGNGEGNEGQSDERGDQDDYGDYWKGYDADWADGKGPGDSGNRGSGGRFEKPGGGYYALSLRMKAEVKTSSLEEALSNLTL